MGADSRIEWTHHTFNPWWGCTKVSPACKNCYAERDARRYGSDVWGANNVRRELSADYWRQPLLWDRKAAKAGERRRVFCGSMCDVMEGGAHLQGIREQQLYPLIEATPNLDWLLLTKWPELFVAQLPAAWLCKPRPNVWGMTTVESLEYVWRAGFLLSTPFAVRGLSVEPMLGPLTAMGVGYGTKLDLVICGGESGPGARPTRAKWVQDLRDECVEQKIAFFFKQWGEWLPELQDGAREGSDEFGQILNASEVPIKVGRKAAGALLDGREWRQMPCR